MYNFVKIVLPAYYFISVLQPNHGFQKSFCKELAASLILQFFTSSIPKVGCSVNPKAQAILRRDEQRRDIQKPSNIYQSRISGLFTWSKRETIHNRTLVTIYCYLMVGSYCSVSEVRWTAGQKTYQENINYISWLRLHFSSRNWDIFLIIIDCQ